MKIGIFSDVHGNLAWLERCLDLLIRNKAEKLFFLGDAIGYLSESSAVIEALELANTVNIMGNHDAMLTGRIHPEESKEAVYQIEGCRRGITGRQLDFISSWPLKFEDKIINKRLLFIHGSWLDPLCGYVYPDTSLEEAFPDHRDFDAIFMGHTHIPFIRKINNRLFVNVGSVGLPRDQGNLISCALFDTGSFECKILRMPGDIQDIITRNPHMHEEVMNCLLRKSDDKLSKNT